MGALIWALLGTVVVGGAIAASGGKKKVPSGAIAGAWSKGGLGIVGGHTGGLEGGAAVQGKGGSIVGPSIAAAAAAAAAAHEGAVQAAKDAAATALRKYGRPNSEGWSSGRDLPPLAMVARAKQIVPSMLDLSLDIAQDLGAAGDGKLMDDVRAGVQLAQGVAALGEQDYAGAAIDGAEAVVGWFSANEAEDERIEFERRAIEIAKQMLEKIVAGESF